MGEAEIADNPQAVAEMMLRYHGESPTLRYLMDRVAADQLAGLPVRTIRSLKRATILFRWTGPTACSDPQDARLTRAEHPFTIQFSCPPGAEPPPGQKRGCPGMVEGVRVPRNIDPCQDSAHP